MPIDTLEVNGAIADRAIEFGGGGETPQTPFFLVPPPPEDPRATVVLGGESANFRQRLFQRIGVRQVERQGGKAKAHHMNMRIDQARQHDAALAILAVVGPRTVVAAHQHLFDPTVIADDQRLEPFDLAVLAHGDALHVID